MWLRRWFRWRRTEVVGLVVFLLGVSLLSWVAWQRSWQTPEWWVPEPSRPDRVAAEGFEQRVVNEGHRVRGLDEAWDLVLDEAGANGWLATRLMDWMRSQVPPVSLGEGVRSVRVMFRSGVVYAAAELGGGRIVTVGVTPDQKKWVEAKGLPTQLRLRLVKITLDTGKVEVLVTSLCDAKRYAAEELAQVYAWRWRVESYIDRLKNIFEVERLASVRREHLKQDFYGVMFLATLESVLVRPAQHALGRQSQQRGTRYEQQVNRAVSYSALLDHTLVLLTDQGKSPEQVLKDLDRKHTRVDEEAHRAALV